MPIDSNIYSQFNTRSVSGGIADALNEYSDRKGRLSQLAQQQELTGQQIRAGQRAEAAIPEQQAELKRAKKQKDMQELSAALAFGIQQKNGISNQDLMNRTYEEAKRRGLQDEDVAQLFSPWAGVQNQTDGVEVGNEYAQLANPQEAIKQRLEAMNQKPLAPSWHLVSEEGKQTLVNANAPNQPSQFGAKPKQDNTLVAVIGPDGKTPTLVRRTEAAGMTPVAKGGKGGTANLSAQAQKELFEADETVQAAKNVSGLLDQALKLNDIAYSGYGAKVRAVARSNLPGSTPEADATIDLDNLMTGQALESLKATFGGMPTEGERKILLDIQASTEKTPAQRKSIMDRAKIAIDKRIKFNSDKAQKLRSGEYFESAPTSDVPQPANIDSLLDKYK